MNALAWIRRQASFQIVPVSMSNHCVASVTRSPDSEQDLPRETLQERRQSSPVVWKVTNVDEQPFDDR